MNFKRFAILGALIGSVLLVGRFNGNKQGAQNDVIPGATTEAADTFSIQTEYAPSAAVTIEVNTQAQSIDEFVNGHYKSAQSFYGSVVVGKGAYYSDESAGRYTFPYLMSEKQIADRDRLQKIYSLVASRTQDDAVIEGSKPAGMTRMKFSVKKL